MGLSFLQSTCLKPSHSLRTQLLLSFGISAFACLTIVVIWAIVSAFLAGRIVTTQANNLMRRQVTDALLTSTKLVAEKFDAYIQDLEGTIQLMVEVVQDRITGYPEPGWEDDLFVPYVDQITNTRGYPINEPPAPMDWQIDVNINAENSIEHAQERAFWLMQFPGVSSASASYFQQGACDPSVTDPTSLLYYPGCTVANSDTTTGGVIQPTNTSYGLHQKSGDLGLFMKALWESQYDALTLGVYFHNSGAGSEVVYPGFHRDGTSPGYESVGCDWMRATNPHTGGPYATEEEIGRCHPKGAIVPAREFNGMERAWCRDFALNSDTVRWYGPFRVIDNGVPLVTVGKAVFDRRTGNFIGCVGLDITVLDLSKQLDRTILTDSEIALVHYNGGLVVADSLNSLLTMQQTSVSISDVGDGLFGDEAFSSFEQMVNFSQAWDSGMVEGAFRESASFGATGGLTTVYPLPVPPAEYDSSYKPVFLVVNAISRDVFNVIDTVDTSIDQDVRQTYFMSLGLGLFGIIVVLLIVWCVSRMLTQPLIWMDALSWRIVNHADKAEGPLEVEDDGTGMSATMRCTPKTEINDLVSEFRVMIKGFSGSGASQVARPAPHEVRNDLTWHSDFSQLYSRSSKRSSFRFKAGATPSESTDEDSSPSTGRSHGSPPTGSLSSAQADTKPSIVPPPAKQNLSRVIGDVRPEREKLSTVRLYRSALFWWILLLIVLPLLVVLVAICAIASTEISTTIPQWLMEVESTSYEIGRKELNMTAMSKSSLVEALIFEPVRDLHLMTRVTGWLVFNGVTQSGILTGMDTAAEECKYFEWNTCPYFRSDRVPCPCDWDDWYADEETCIVHNSSESTEAEWSRNLLKLWYVGQSQDADPLTGRLQEFPSFPPAGSTPNTTSWWSGLADMPGYAGNFTLLNHSTTYGRLWLASAAATGIFPTYLYGTALKRKKPILGLYVAFEEDGLFLGFNGCLYSSGNQAFWVSSERNLGAVVARRICPLGKYGYDPRCRDWYAAGRDLYTNENVPVHITAPYPFATEKEIAVSATSPIANPTTGEYVGQMLVDFYPSAVRSTIVNVRQPISLLITTETDPQIGDTVVGPNKSAGYIRSPIVDLLFEAGDSVSRLAFEQGILSAMKNGSNGMTEFSRTRPDGRTEVLTIAFAPVFQRVLLPLDPSDFSRGVNVSHVLVYSVGIVQYSEALFKPFLDIEGDIDNELGTLRIVYMVVTAIVAIAFTTFAGLVTMRVTTQMITLLGAVQNINSGRVEDDFPPLVGGSREVNRVYNTFSKLYKIVRISNTAFFSGNLKWAFHFVVDALLLFRKVGDEKAVAIACNNLGNTLYAAQYHETSAFELGEETVGNDGDDSDAIALALKHYDEAISQGQKDFDSAVEPELKCDFALQLSDRLFNRGLFLLLIAEESNAPEDARDRGYSDIQRSRSLDYDVKDYMLANKILLKRSAEYFSRLITRINGLADFYGDEGLSQVWDVKELLDDADQLLFAAWNEPHAPLFEEINRVGRLQELEGAAILLWSKMGNDTEAARLAMRMFSEDQYILEAAFVRAGEALLRVLRDDGESLTFTKKTVSCAREDLRRMSKSCKNVSLDVGKCMVFAVEVNEGWEGDALLEKINVNCLRLYDRHCAENDYIGICAYGTEDTLTTEIGQRERTSGRQRELLHRVTSSTAERANPVFPLAVQMVIDSQTTCDSYLVVIFDGYAWAGEACASIRSRIERLNRERNALIHLFIIGLDVEDESAREDCQRLCSVSKLSFYQDATLENVDSIFEDLTAVVSGRRVSNGTLKGITMQKF